MGYISAVRMNNDVVVWDRVDGVRTMTLHKAPFYYYKQHPMGEHVSIFGDKLERCVFDTFQEFNQARMSEYNRGNTLFESDIPPELKYLSEAYYDKPAPKLHITFFDIEVAYHSKKYNGSHVVRIRDKKL